MPCLATRRRFLALAALAAVGVLPGSVSAQAGPGKLSILGYTAPISRTWVSEQPASSYRAAQYKVPGTAGAGEAEVVVFYFGKGQGGSVAANIQRWASQFTTPDGKPVPPKTQVLTLNNLPVTTVELTGNYSRGVGTGPQGEAKPQQTLLVAVLEAPEGNITMQLHGPRDTVAANRKSFEAMYRGFRKGS